MKKKFLVLILEADSGKRVLDFYYKKYAKSFIKNHKRKYKKNFCKIFKI